MITYPSNKSAVQIENPAVNALFTISPLTKNITVLNDGTIYTFTFVIKNTSGLYILSVAWDGHNDPTTPWEDLQATTYAGPNTLPSLSIGASDIISFDLSFENASLGTHSTMFTCLGGDIDNTVSESHGALINVNVVTP